MEKITGKSVWQNADPYLEEKLSTTKIIALEKSIESALKIYAEEYANQFNATPETAADTPSEKNSDAVEFADWLVGNYDWLDNEHYDTDELYQIFKSK